MAEDKAIRTATQREVDTTEKKGGYPAGDKTAAQMTPPPSSWLRPAARPGTTGGK